MSSINCIAGLYSYFYESWLCFALLIHEEFIETMKDDIRGKSDKDQISRDGNVTANSDADHYKVCQATGCDKQIYLSEGEAIPDMEMYCFECANALAVKNGNCDKFESVEPAFSRFDFPQFLHVYHHYSASNPAFSAQNETENEAPSIMSSAVENLRDLFSKAADVIGSPQRESEPVRNESNDIEERDPSLTKGKIDTDSGEEPGDDGNSCYDEWDDDIKDLNPQSRNPWSGLSGVAVMSFGVVAPLLITTLMVLTCPKRITLLLLNHPLETILELFIWMIIPYANYRVWSAICRNDTRFSLTRGILLGISIFAGLLVGTLSMLVIPFSSEYLANNASTDFLTGFFVLGALAFASSTVGMYLTYKIRASRDFRISKLMVVSYVVAGCILGSVSFLASEVRPWCVRYAERLAVSSNLDDRRTGLRLLRNMNTEKELKMECSDSRSIGLVGLFMPFKNEDAHRLYFTVTGKPFMDEGDENFSAMSDDYLRRHVIGEHIKGLSLVRSAVNGAVHPNNLTSTLSWTYVFKNNTSSPQEARAQIALPKGAVISGLTVWQNGEPLEANFAATGKAARSYSSVNVGHNSPAIISDLGRGRHLFHCYPVPKSKQLRVQITAVVPLELSSIDAANLTVPRFMATNFSLVGAHSLRLESTHRIESKLANLKMSKSASGLHVLEGILAANQIDHAPLVLRARRDKTMRTIACGDLFASQLAYEDAKAQAEAEERERKENEEPDNITSSQVVVMLNRPNEIGQQIADVNKAIKLSKKRRRKKKKILMEPRYVIRTITETTLKSPKRVVIVLDGSETTKTHLSEIKDALTGLPESLPVSLMVASQETELLAEPQPLKQALKQLDKVKFQGGQSNLKAVVKASEIAGQAKGGVVLWIHGAQPMLFPDIYIMSPFASRPELFELSLDSGETDTLEYFKNHAEISAFTPIQRTNHINEDLNELFAKFKSGTKSYQANYKIVKSLTHRVPQLTKQEQNELRILNARKTVHDLTAEKYLSRAARIAVAYQIVTPISCVAVLSDSSSALQGATNGTIGAQGGDASAIMGVNTAGTTRVNNLANLEALLNIIANLVEMGCLVIGGAITIHGLFVKGTVKRFLGMKARLTPFNRLALGIFIALLGLMTPGLINWFVASARDANLFS